jgi:hypothetical protein
MTMRVLTLAAVAALSLASQSPALAEDRYGLRCTIVDSGEVYRPNQPMSPFLDPPRVRTFVIDADKNVWRERFIGADGPATPFTFDRRTSPSGIALMLDGSENLYVWLSSDKDNDVLHAGWTENSVWGLEGKIVFKVEGRCEEVADITDVDLPGKNFVERAKKSLNGLVGGK